MFNHAPPRTPLERFENAKRLYNSSRQYYSGSTNPDHASNIKKDYDNMVAKYELLSEEEKQLATLPNFVGVPKEMYLPDDNSFRMAKLGK